MKRVVIGTNVFVNALLLGGVFGKLLPLWKEGIISSLCSKEIIEEYLRVLSCPKFTLTKSEIECLLTQQVLPWFEVIPVKSGSQFAPHDPSDNKFLWCSLQGKAQAIISGDEHLRSLAFSPVSVFTVHEFLNTFTKQIQHPL